MQSRYRTIVALLAGALPSLPGFLEAYPDIDIYISEGDRLGDLVREGIDCVLRVGDLQDSDMIARRVAMLEEITLASPAYTARHGMPIHPDALEERLKAGNGAVARQDQSDRVLGVAGLEGLLAASAIDQEGASPGRHR